MSIDIYAPPLVFWFLYDGPSTRLEVSGPVEVRSPTETVRFDPGAEASGFSVLAGLLGQVVTQAIPSEDGSLALAFENGWLVFVEASPGEPWWLEVRG